MSTRIYHGDIHPEDFANSLMASFNRGNYQVQKFGNPKHMAVQIATSPSKRAGKTALTANIMRVPDGVSVTLSSQDWIGLAASLGTTALTAIRNPLALLKRLDVIAQDIESVQLEDKVWEVIDATAKQLGTGFTLSERLNRSACPYCATANEVSSSHCIACGAPLGELVPKTCPNCGFVVNHNEESCPNCQFQLDHSIL
ncbi:MAG: zinc ribbon domain-containing protein [Chloroflexi bacterium]|nr:zinc ribbon domain-containing protein [Chloroflexota bacterium]